MKNVFLIAAALATLSACTQEESDMKKRTEIQCSACESAPFPETALPANEEEWKKKLTPEQFTVLRRGGTETPYSGKYLHHKEDGTYACMGCGQALYDSKTKYDACGWPSFWEALPGAVETRRSGPSVEAICSRCQGHLGHIFDDGPPPTGKRH